MSREQEIYQYSRMEIDSNMTKEQFRKRLAQGKMILDGATGSNLQERGLPAGVCPEEWILENPDVLKELQIEYYAAGSDAVYAPTFSGNRIKLEEYGLQDNLVEMNHGLVAISKQAVAEVKERGLVDADKPLYVCGDLTMTGKQVQPMGPLSFEELVDIYKEQIEALVDAGVDFLAVETMMSLQECRAAVIAAKECCDLPIMVTLTFAEDGRTLFGTDPETAALVLTTLGVDALGVNCSTGPDKMCDVVRKMRAYADVPLVAKPNAGLPQLVDGKTVYEMEALEFAEEMMDKPISYYAFQMLYWTGIREGELLALTPADFDFERGTVKISKTYQRLKGKDVITSPKTKKSNRTIQMPDFLCEEMQEFFKMQYGLKKKDRIFTINKSYLHREMDRGAEAAGVKRIRIHDLRHSHISLLIDMGFSAVAIADRVGHESIEITYRYAHLFPSKQKEMANRLDDLGKGV